ncbi:MAG: hypothetical protein VB142_11965 [Burkholderia sp.]
MHDYRRSYANRAIYHPLEIQQMHNFSAAFAGASVLTLLAERRMSAEFIDARASATSHS